MATFRVVARTIIETVTFVDAVNDTEAIDKAQFAVSHGETVEEWEPILVEKA